jgi:hypothetical protein
MAHPANAGLPLSRNLRLTQDQRERGGRQTPEGSKAVTSVDTRWDIRAWDVTRGVGKMKVGSGVAVRQLLPPLHGLVHVLSELSF